MSGKNDKTEIENLIAKAYAEKERDRLLQEEREQRELFRLAEKHQDRMHILRGMLGNDVMAELDPYIVEEHYQENTSVIDYEPEALSLYPFQIEFYKKPDEISVGADCIKLYFDKQPSYYLLGEDFDKFLLQSREKWIGIQEGTELPF